MATVDGDAAACCKWVGFRPFFFPASNSFLRFGSDLEIVSICLLFIDFFVSILGSSKMVHGWSFLSRESLYFSCLNIWIWFKICWFTGVIFGFQRL